ncbi:TRAP transporter permease [Chloroflexota bacterium]
MASTERGVPVGRVSKGFAKYLTMAYAGIGIFAAIWFMWAFRIFGFSLDNTRFIYLMLSIFTGLFFLLFPISPKKGPFDRIPWYDILFSLTMTGSCLYFMVHTWEVQYSDWAFFPPLTALVLGIAMWALLLEAARRRLGLVFFGIVLILSTYPLYADKMPLPLTGPGFQFKSLVGLHVMGSESIRGFAIRIAGTYVISFVLFGVGIIECGGSKFFMNLALALLGTVRGGLAKVAIVASAIFGSLSGSASVNVITTGSVTIPAMKKHGYRSYYAAAIEATASTGGVLMPPVMGTVAFIMASFLQIPYYQVAMAAAIPAFLFFLTIFIQVDLHSKKASIAKVPKEDIPSLKQTLKEGWYFIPPALLLFYLLFFQRIEAKAAWYSLGVMVLLYFFRDKNSYKGIHKELPRLLARMLQSTVGLFGQVFGLFACLGLIIGAVMLTGLSMALSGSILAVTGGNLWLTLIFTAMACYVLGMGISTSAVYILVVILAAPALINLGIPKIAAHLFCLYGGMMACIIPPVAATALVASRLADAPYLRTAFQSMRLGAGLFLLPFFFVMSPSLVLQGSWITFLIDFPTCVLGMVLLAGGIEGAMYFMGKLNILNRIFFVAAGLLLAIPGWQTDVYGLAVGAVAIIIYLIWNRGFGRGSMKEEAA